MKFVVNAAFVALLLGSGSATPLDKFGGGKQEKQGADKMADDIKDNLTDKMSHFQHNAEITHEHVRKLLFREEETEVIVVYKNARGADKIMEKGKNKIKGQLDKFNFIAMTASQKDIEEFLEDPDIERVEIDYEMKALSTPNLRGDSGGQNQRKLAETLPYGIDMVQANAVQPGPDAKDIKVCVVDTGYGLGHPDLPTNKVTGYNPYSSGSWDVDGDSHGTHCAGTIAALGGNNDQGVVGVIPDAGTTDGISLHIGKGLTDTGSGSSTGVLAAVNNCVSAGANVISMSLGGGPFSTTADNVYKNAIAQGALVIAAAGNGRSSALSYPASYDDVMSVAANDSTEKRVYFSQWNNQVEISAPGSGVYSTVTTNGGSIFGYDFKSGTSMATPHVAGVAALVWSYDKGCTPSQIRGILLRSAKDLGAPTCDIEFGHGMVQAQAAVQLLQNEGCSAGDGYDSGAGCSIGPPPTPLPPCPAGEETTVVINLTTDNYPEETTWEVADIAGTIVANGGPYSTQGGTNTASATVCAGRDYTFTIRDTYGDGICCQYGNGSYEVTYDGETIASGGAFGTGAYTTFAMPAVTTEPPEPTTSTSTSTSVTTTTTKTTTTPPPEPTEEDTTTTTTDPPTTTTTPLTTTTTDPPTTTTTPLTTTTTDPPTTTTDPPTTTTTTPAPPSWTEVDFEDFEGGWGIWNDGGSDARRSINDAAYAHSGNYCVRIRDNSGSASSITSDTLNMSPYSDARVTFRFYARSMETGEDFWLQYSNNNGATWTTVGTWVRGVDFENNAFYNPSVTFASGGASQAKFRFRCDASVNNDRIYLDDIRVEGLPS